MEDEFVCPSCFSDPGLRQYVDALAEEEACSFCDSGMKNVVAASLDKVVEYIESCIHAEYDDAANWLPFESAEGGYQGKSWDTYDLLADELQLDLPQDTDGRLFEALLHGLEFMTWCEVDPFGLNDQQLAQFSWDRFCRVVKHERRFFFSNHGTESKEGLRLPPDDTLAPGETLQYIFDCAETMEVFVTLKRGSLLHRARFQKLGERLTTAKQLGPPLEHQAVQANRMSPAGIVMFYASDTPETALRETASDEGTFVVGRFETRRDAIILDLTQLPPIPTLFEEVPDSLEYDPRKVLSFLHLVTLAMSQPIARDDRVHISYVPTQIVTEYLRSRVLYDGMSVEGVRFPSAVDQHNASYVIFATQDNISPAEDQPHYSFRSDTDRWLELVDSKVHEVANDDLVRWRNEENAIGYFDLGDPDTVA